MKCFILIIVLCTTTTAFGELVNTPSPSNSAYATKYPLTNKPIEKPKSLLPNCKDIENIEDPGLPGVRIHAQTPCIGTNVIFAPSKNARPPQISEELKNYVLQSETIEQIRELARKYPVLKLVGVLAICQPTGNVSLKGGVKVNPTGVQCRYTTSF